MVDYGGAAVVFTGMLFLTHFAAPLSVVIAIAVLARTPRSRLRWRCAAKIAAWIAGPWLAILLVLVAVGEEPLHAFLHLEPLTSAVPRLSLFAAALLSVVLVGQTLGSAAPLDPNEPIHSRRRSPTRRAG
jgi:hypothetical protein